MTNQQFSIAYASQDEVIHHGTWECGPGESDLHFQWTETVYIIEGKVVVENLATGEAKTLLPGDLATFEKGSSWKWRVPWRLKKVFTIVDFPMEKGAPV